MAYFIVRVELHEISPTQKPTWYDYERLHKAMQKHNYFRVIKSDDGKWYHMPPATYSAWSNTATRDQILQEVKAIVQTVWTKAGQLVIEGSSNWIGLVPASAQDVQRLAS